MSVALEANGLWHRYRTSGWALQDVSLNLDAGTTTALVGPNGAGKSTLMRTWVGFERPSRGSVAVHGADPSRSRARAVSQIGYVPQQPALYRRLTVGQHLDLAAHLRPRFARGAAEARLDELGIDRSRRAGELSGGQQSQVSLVLALGAGARVLLLDEPLASLDPLARREFVGVLLATARELGATTLMSSHLVGDIGDVCERLIVLAGGRIQLNDTIGQVTRDHVITEGSVADSGAVGSFVGLDGNRLALWHGTPAGQQDGLVRPATLEEVVMGYLTRGRP
ncbi:hypothetical protein BH20CHL6_BH20CHL6_01370 [soil metagenome]